MEATLLMVLPVIAVVVAGYAAAKFRYLSESVFDGLAQFVFLVAVPIFIFRTMARTTLLDKSLGNLGEFLGLYFLAAAGAMVVGMLVARFALQGAAGEQAKLGIAGSHSNMVLLGIPAVTLIVSNQVVTPMLLLVGLHGMAMALLVAVALRVQGGRGGDPVQAVIEHAKSPIFIALVAGIIFGKLDLSLPAKINSVLSMFAETAVPCGLFALGGALVRYKVGERTQFEMTAAAVKLVAHPLIIWLVAKQLKLFTIPNSWVWVAVMLAAMPAGFELLARGKRADKEIPGSTILVTTGLAAITVTVLTHIIRTG